jgi:hypothetical protein
MIIRKAASLALPRPRDPLLDDLTKVSIDQTPDGSYDRIHKAIVTDAVLSHELRKRFDFENAHSASLVLGTIVLRPIFQGKNAQGRSSNGGRQAAAHRNVRVDDPATDRNCFSTMFGYSGFHGDPA